MNSLAWLRKLQRSVKSAFTAAALQFAKQRMHAHVDALAATAMEEAMVGAGNLVGRDMAMGKLRAFEEAAAGGGGDGDGASGAGAGYSTPAQSKRAAQGFTMEQGPPKRPASRNGNGGEGSASRD